MLRQALFLLIIGVLVIEYGTFGQISNKEQNRTNSNVRNPVQRRTHIPSIPIVKPVPYPKTTITKSACVMNRRIVTINSYQLQGGQYKPTQRRVIESCGPIINCPPSRKENGPCIANSRVVWIISYIRLGQNCRESRKRTTERCVMPITINCPPNRKENGPCIANSRVVWIISYIRLGQHCRESRKRTTERCEILIATTVCKKPEIRTSCDKAQGILTKIYISYRLTNIRGKPVCVESVTKSSSTIEHKPVYKTIRGKVDKNCTRLDATYVTKRVACEIKTVLLRNDTKIACCRPPTVTIKRCSFNNLITNVFDHVIKNNVCVRVLKSSSQSEIKCPPPNVKTSDCVRDKLTQTTTTFTLHQCKCIPQKIRKILPCKCKLTLLRPQNLTCNRNTCQRLTIYHFQNSSCEYYKKVCFVECCCKENTTTQSQCDPTTGRLHITSKKHTFDKNENRCLSQTETKFENIICNKTEKSSQSCNKDRPNFRKIVTVTSRLSHQHCRCGRVSSVSWECCSIPPRNVSQECRGSSLYETNITYRCSEDKSRLIAARNSVVKQIQCPSLNQKEQTERISPCQVKSCHHYYEIKNCKCERRKRCHTFFECCDKQIKTVNCLNGTRSLTTVTNFTLSRDKKNCSRITQTNWKTITCEIYTKYTRTPCNQSVYHRITETFGVRNCKCQKINETRIKKICDCPKPKIEKVCLGRVNRNITTKYTLVNEDKCIPRKTISDKLEVCKPQSIREGPCDPKTNRKPITRTYYDIVNCQCQRKELTTHLLCPCSNKPIRYSRIIDQPNCTETVKVYRYMALNHTCGWKLVCTYKGDICCPRQSVKRICVGHNIERTTIQKYGLEFISSLYPYHKCRKSIQIIDKAVECCPDYSSNEPCLDGVQIRVECRFIKQNCKCVKLCRKVAIRPWNCCRKSFCKKECRQNQEYSICFNFTAGRTRCVESRSEKIIPHQCKRDERRECAAALINKHNGHYKSCVTSFNVYRDCRCERVTKVNEVLVNCQNSTSTVECRRNRKVIILKTYISNNNKCEIKTTEQVAKIDCPPHSITTRHETRRIEYTLVHYVITYCRCSKATIVRYTPKCERPTVDRICKNNQQVFTHTSFHEIFGPKLFPEVRSDLRTIKCQNTTRIEAQPVKCSLNETIESCVVKEKRVRIEHRENFPENCKCKRKVTVTSRPNCLECRAPIINLGPCLPRNSSARGYQTETITKWQVSTNNKCEQSETRGKRICRCERSTVSRECNKGVLITKRTSYSLPNCQPTVQTTVQPSHCYNNGRENKWILVKTSRCQIPGQFTVAHFERFNFDPSNCQCKNITKSVKTDICCRPCRTETQCVNNKFFDTRICEQPTNLTCKNIVNKTARAVECLARPIIQRSGCTHRYGNGIYNKIETTMDTKKDCKCTRRMDTRYELCRCDETVQNTRCENNQYVTRTYSFTKLKASSPYDYKCERKESTARSNPKPCPPPTKELKSCSGRIKIFVETIHTMTNCLCLRKEETKVEDGSDCDSKHCFEIPDDTECLRFKNGEDCSNEFGASSCPVTCKICEECKSKNPNDPKDPRCEANVYNNVTVWARKL